MPRSAVVFEYGDTSQIQVVDLPKPGINADEVLVRIHAAGVNLVDTLFREGYLETGPFPLVLGSDFSGVVEAVGSDVTILAVGDEVFGYKLLGNGTYAEFAAIPEKFAAHKPAALSFAQAAAMPCVGLVAYEALARTLAVQPGETVLIGGASGGVGHLAVQIAVALGGRVIATASPANVDFVQSLGAQHVIDHSKPGVAARVRSIVPGGVDVALPTVSACEDESVAAVRDNGRISWINTPDGPTLERGITGAFTNGSAGTELLDRLSELVASGGIHTVAVSRTFGLEDAASAQLSVADGNVLGKQVIEIAG